MAETPQSHLQMSFGIYESASGRATQSVCVLYVALFVGFCVANFVVTGCSLGALFATDQGHYWCPPCLGHSAGFLSIAHILLWVWSNPSFISTSRDI